MTCATAVSFSQGFGPLALAPMFPDLIEAFDSDLAGVVQFTGIAILVLGFSNFIWCVFTSTRKPFHIYSRNLSLSRFGVDVVSPAGFPFKHPSDVDRF